MQKKIIALAIAAAFSAPAFADSTVYGLVDVGYGSVQNTKTSTAGVESKTGQSGVSAFSQNQTSKVGVTSSEDLGNGMKATFQLEMGLSSNPASDAAFDSTAGTVTGGATAGGFTQNASIGPDRVLAAMLNLGQGTTLIGGRISSPMRNIAYGNDAQYGSNLVGNLVTLDANMTARANVLAASHNFGSVVATVAALGNTYTADGAADIKSGTGYEASAIYNEGALSVSGAYRSMETSAVATTTVAATDATTKAMILAANYNFGVAKVYGEYATVNVDEALAQPTLTPTTTGKKTMMSAGVNVPFTSAFAGYVELSSGKDEQVANGAAADSRNYSGYGVGVRYDLSKTTWTYAHIGTMKQEQTTAHAGDKVDQVAFGLVKSF